MPWIRDALFLPIAAATVGINSYYQDAIVPSEFKYSYGILFGFYAVELGVSKLTPEFLLHHTMSLFFISYDLFRPYDTRFRTAVLNVEIPSIVLTIVPYLPTPLQYPANLLFVGLFFKTRLLDIYPFLTVDCSALNGVIWCFYLLNLYWGLIILRKLSKPVLGVQNMKPVMHTLCAFTFAASFVIHSHHETALEQICHVALALSSFRVHWNFDNVDPFWWVSDIVFMHLVCITKHQVGFRRIHDCYLFASYALHATVVGYRIYWLDEYTLSFSMASMFFDGIVTLQQFQKETQVAVILAAVCVMLTEKIKPFYDLSFVAVHLWIVLIIHLYLTAT